MKINLLFFSGSFFFVNERTFCFSSADYAETMGKSEHISESPGIAGILMGRKAGSLTERGQRSFRGMKQRLEEATSEIRHNAHW